MSFKDTDDSVKEYDYETRVYEHINDSTEGYKENDVICPKTNGPLYRLRSGKWEKILPKTREQYEAYLKAKYRPKIERDDFCKKNHTAPSYTGWGYEGGNSCARTVKCSCGNSWVEEEYM